MFQSCTGHVFQLQLASPTLKPAVTTNTYLVKSQDHLIVIDPGFDYADNTRKIIQTIEELGRPSNIGIVLTHYHKDHALGVHDLARHYSCPIYCHEKEANLVDEMIQPSKHTNALKDGDHLQIGSLDVTVIHTPGHTPGHIALHVVQDEILLTGDTVISEGSTWIGPPDGHMKSYLQSLEKLKQFPVRLIGPGHGSIIQDPKAAIEWFLERRLSRESQIYSLLKLHHQVSVAQLVSEIYEGQVHPKVIWAAEKTVLAHLIKLVEDDKAREVTSEQTTDDLREFVPRN